MAIFANNNLKINDLWKRYNGSWEIKPHTESICKIGKKLNVDVVFTGKVTTYRGYLSSGIIAIFLIDVRTGKMFHASKKTDDLDDLGFYISKKLLQKILNDYNRWFRKKSNF